MSLSPAIQSTGTMMPDPVAGSPWGFHLPWLRLVAVCPVIVWFCRRLDDGSDEPLGLLTLVLAIALAWRDRKSLAASAPARICGAAMILVSALGVHGMPPMIRAAFAVIGMSACLGIHKRPGLAGLFLLSLPLAASLQFFLGYPLRVAAAEGAVRLLELASLVVTRSGTQLELGGQVIGVDPACGGVRMLWHALAAAMGLAAIHRLSWRATVVAGAFAVALVIPANALRAALLAVKESGHYSGFSLGHEGIGLLCFLVILGPLWLAASSRARGRWDQGPHGAVHPVESGLTTIAALLAPILMFTTPRTPDLPSVAVAEPHFVFNGLSLPLEPLPKTAVEIAFAKSFPGTLNSYKRGSDQVVLREVTEATRRLHPSRDCLRAAGFETTEALTVTLGDGTRWSRFHATKNGSRHAVHERIVSELDGSSWTDVSAWYWHALWHPLNGPWRAETLISR